MLEYLRGLDDGTGVPDPPFVDLVYRWGLDYCEWGIEWCDRQLRRLRSRRPEDLPEPTWRSMLGRGLPNFALEGFPPVLVFYAFWREAGWRAGLIASASPRGSRGGAAAARPRPR